MGRLKQHPASERPPGPGLARQADRAALGLGPRCAGATTGFADAASTGKRRRLARTPDPCARVAHGNLVARMREINNSSSQGPPLRALHPRHAAPGCTATRRKVRSAAHRCGVVLNIVNTRGSACQAPLSSAASLMPGTPNAGTAVYSRGTTGAVITRPE